MKIIFETLPVNKTEVISGNEFSPYNYEKDLSNIINRYDNNDDKSYVNDFSQHNNIISTTEQDEIFTSHEYNIIQNAEIIQYYISVIIGIMGIFMLLALIVVLHKERRAKSRYLHSIKEYFCTAPVVVTSSTHVPPNAGVNYPNAGVNYPVDEPVRNYQSAHPPYSQSSYPMPQPAAVHTTAPYPTNNTGMPMPQSSAPYPPAQPMGYQAPYPPVQNPQDVLPPSYDQVVGTTGPTTTPYNKQSPYNPHFTGN